MTSSKVTQTTGNTRTLVKLFRILPGGQKPGQNWPMFLMKTNGL